MISPSAVGILKHLTASPSATFREMSHIGSRSLLQRRLRELEDLELITREGAPQRGRKMLYHVTEQGKRVLALFTMEL